MDQQTYSALGFFLSTAAGGLLLALHRRRAEIPSRAWLLTWGCFTGHYLLQLLFGFSGARPIAAAAGSLLILAALSLLRMAELGPLRPVTRRWHYVVAGAGLVLSCFHAYSWPPWVAPAQPAIAASLLFLYSAFCFRRQNKSHELLSLRLFCLASLLLAGVAGTGLRAGWANSIPAIAGSAAAGYGLLVLAVAMVGIIYEEAQRAVEENLLGLSSLNLATSASPAGESLQGILNKVLERILRVYGLSQGLITLEGSERRPGIHVFRGFPSEVAGEWERRNMDGEVTWLVERLGGLMILRDLQQPEATGRLESDAVYGNFREVMKLAGNGALLALALQTKNSMYGALVLSHPAARALSVAELRLAATLAGQIAMAVENFLLVQDSHRRAEELRLLNQTGQAMSSTLNPDALLRLVHQEIQKLMDSRNFYIALWNEPADEIRFELEVENGIYLPKRSRKERRSITEYVLRTRQPLLLKTRPDEFRAAHGIEPSLRPPCCWLGVPVMLYDRAVGVMAVQNFEREYAYDEGHLDIMKTLAAQAAIALENARLFSEEQRRLRQLSFLHNISRIAISTMNSDEMLAEIAREIQKNFAYDHIGIGLLDYQTKEIEIKAEAGTHAQALGRRIPLDVGVIGRVARTGEMMLVNDMLGEGAAQRTQSILTNARAELCLPIVYAEQMLGVLNVESVQESAFQHEEVLVLRTLADHLSTALHNAFIFQRTQQQAITDGLTGVKTHRFFVESLQAEWKRAMRAGRIFSLIVLDLDRFKQVNDTMGHLEGDLVLTRLGKLLEQRCRQSNVVARYGGDEFMILMPEATTEQAHILADRLRLWIATDTVFSERKLTASFGLATYPSHGDTPEEIIRAADAGLYLSKHQGGNLVRVAEQFRRQGETKKWHSHVLFTYLESLGRRLEATGSDVLETMLQRLEEAWPAFPGDPLELERAVLEGMASLADSVDRRVHGATGHMAGVTRYAMLLAAALQLSDRQQDGLQAAARIHDVGYVAVPGGVLSKNGRLAPLEFQAIQSHSAAGARLLETLHVNNEIVEMVRHHHEYFNGRGYPDHLAADDIPLGSRILAVADAFESLTSERPHRRARSVADAIEELERFSGTQFDPMLVKVFARVIRSEAGAPESGAPVAGVPTG